MSLRTFTLLVCFPVICTGQELLISFSTDIVQVPVDLKREEIFRHPSSGGLRPFIVREMLNVVFGDRNQNGTLDDGPNTIDAFEAVSVGGLPSWHWSVSSNLTMADGSTLKDGDIFRFDGSGRATIAFGEDFLATATGTATVDVDAFAINSNGDLYFSFEEDEVTTSASLIATNGGNATLDEQTVFILANGQTQASIFLTQTQVAQVFNAALGLAITSVVDVVGLAMDPQGAPNQILLTSASTSASLRGRVVSTVAGGSVPSFGGVAFDPINLGQGSTVQLDLLATTVEAAPPVLRATPDRGSTATGGPAEFSIEGLVPGESVQIVVSEPPLPGPVAWSQPTASGFRLIYPDPTQQIFWDSLVTPAWRLLADAQGRARYAFDFLGLPANTQAIVQAVVPTGLKISTPAAIVLLP